MDVLSIESCVQAVISAYKDASKLVQRLKDKQKHGDDFMLPEDLTKEFEDSLTLGCSAVQSQYDHDVRRFGETYARGDSTAREQMKDILISLQQAVISHLREVFMDEAALNLYSLKETSDDCRVNATVCLGQLYQRMSTATAAVKQISSRPYADSVDQIQLPPSLAYSSSRSTHSSFGGQAFDAQSAASYNTYSSKTATEIDHKPNPGRVPQRRISLNSAFSYTSDRDRPLSRTPGEDSVPAMPFLMVRQTSQTSVPPATGQSPRIQDDDRSSMPASPPPYVPNASVHASDDKGQKFPPGSSFYEAPTTNTSPPPPQPTQPVQNQLQPSSMRHTPPRVNGIQGNVVQPIHELDHESTSVVQPSSGDNAGDQGQYSANRQPVPLNPDYSTLEYVESLEIRSRPPAAVISQQEYQEYVQQHHLQSRLRPQPLFSQPNRGIYPNLHSADLHDQRLHDLSPVSQDHQVHQDYATAPPGLYQYQTLQRHPSQDPYAPQRTLSYTQSNSGSGSQIRHTGESPPQARINSSSTMSRPLSIRSTSSTSSKIASYAIRKGLPPGIADAIHKPTPSPIEEAIKNQPRYVKPHAISVTQDSSRVAPGPTSPIAQHMRTLSAEDRHQPANISVPSLESTMRAPGSTSLQIARSDLNLPCETNLAGFCKGAVRHQLGGRKKGFGQEHRRGIKGQEYFFKCTKCNFEGPAAVSKALPSGGRGGAKVEKTYDTKVRVAEGNIKYRWAFLAKSHVLNKGNASDARNSNDVYACYFCCAEGGPKGWFDDSVNAHLATLSTSSDAKSSGHTTPTFNGLDAFMKHLTTHRLPGRRPGLIVANEMNCIVGRTAHDSEDFDLNLPPLTT